jgi:hypothetical protein
MDKNLRIMESVEKGIQIERESAAAGNSLLIGDRLHVRTGAAQKF